MKYLYLCFCYDLFVLHISGPDTLLCYYFNKKFSSFQIDLCIYFHLMNPKGEKNELKWAKVC